MEPVSGRPPGAPARLFPVYAVVALVPFMWAGNYIGSKLAFAHWSPFGFMALRFMLMAPLACALALATGESLAVRRADWWRFVVAGACGYGLYQLLFIVGLTKTTVFASSLLNSTFPIFTIAFGTLLGLERSRPGRWAGAMLALVGVATFEGAFNGQASFKTGDILSLGCAVIFAIYMLVVRDLSKRYGARSLLAVTISIGTLMLLPAGIGGLEHQNFAALDARDWFIFAYVVTIPILLGYLILNWAIGKIGAAPASMMGFAVPVIAGALSITFLHAPLLGYEIVGAVLCIAGMLLAETVDVAFAARRAHLRLLEDERSRHARTTA